MNIISLLFSVVLILAMQGCGGGSGNSSSTVLTIPGFSIKGNISGNGYAKNSIFDDFLNLLITPSFALNSASPDAILAIYNNGNSSRSFPIAPDGSFSVDTSLISQNDIVLFVVNSTTKKIYCHLNLVSNSSDNLILFRKDLMNANISVGNVNSANNCSTFENINTVKGFKSDKLQELKNIARNNDGVALYINNYLNPDVQTYTAVKFSMGSLNSIVGKFNLLDANLRITNFSGVSPLFFPKVASFPGLSSVNLYSPSSTRHCGGYLCPKAYDFTNTSIYQNILDFTNPAKAPAWLNSSDAYTVETPSINNFPSGEWKLKNSENGNAIGTFIFEKAEQIFDSNGYAKIIIPKLNIATNNSGAIASITVQYWIQLADGSYQQSTLDHFNNVAYNVAFSYVLNGTNISANFNLISEAPAELKFIPDKAIQLSDVNRVIYSYILGGQKIQYFFQ